MTSWIDQSRLNDALKAIEPIQKIVFEEKLIQSIRGLKLEDIYNRQYVLLAKQALLRLTADITEQKAVDAELEKLGLSEKEALKRLDPQPAKNQNNSADAAQKELQANNEKHYADIQQSGPISDIPLTEFLCKDAQGNFIYDDKIENRQPQIHPRVREQFNKTKEALQKLLLVRTTSKNLKEHLDLLQPHFFRLELFLMVFTADLEKAILNAKLLHAKNQLDTVVPDLAAKNSQLKQQTIDLERLQATETKLSNEMAEQANKLATLERGNTALTEEKNALTAEVKELQAVNNQLVSEYDRDHQKIFALENRIRENQNHLRAIIEPLNQNQWIRWTAIGFLTLLSVGLVATGIAALAGTSLLPGVGLIYGIAGCTTGSLFAYFAKVFYTHESQTANSIQSIETVIEEPVGLAPASQDKNAANEAGPERDNDNRFHAIVVDPAKSFELGNFTYVNSKEDPGKSAASFFGYLGSFFSASKHQEDPTLLSEENAENDIQNLCGRPLQNYRQD